MKTTNEILASPEFGLACAILSFGEKLECLDRSDPGRILFCFKRSESVERIQKAYWTGVLMVNANHYYSSLKFLKARIRNEH